MAKENKEYRRLNKQSGGKLVNSSITLPACVNTVEKVQYDHMVEEGYPGYVELKRRVENNVCDMMNSKEVSMYVCMYVRTVEVRTHMGTYCEHTRYVTYYRLQ